MQTAPPVSAVPSEPVDGLSAAHERSSPDGVITRLVDAAPTLDALRKHRLHLAAARLWRSRGQAVPPDLVSDERAAAVRAMLTRFVLGQARSAYGGALVLMKGPEIAAHYSVPSDRPFSDLDLLVEDPAAAQRALIEAGFVELGEPAAYAGLQHLPPLMWPGTPLQVELHRHPSQPFWLPPISPESVFRIAVPSATGVSGILAPEPGAHAVLVAAHAWADGLLASVGQLLDVAALLACSDHRRSEYYARTWGWEGMWHTTLAVMDAVIGGERPSLALKLWAGHLLDVRERVVLENHIGRLAGPVRSLPAREAPRAVARALRYTAAPEHDEDWITQLRRSCLAIVHAFRLQSEHEQSLAWIGPRTTPRRPRSMRVRRRSVGRTAFATDVRPAQEHGSPAEVEI